MKRTIFKSNNKLFATILKSILFLVVVTILISSVTLYFSYEKIMLEQAYISDMKNLERNENDTAVMTELAQTLSAQIFCDLNVSSLLFSKSYNMSELRAAMVQLNNYRLTLPFIESIYVYNGTTKEISVSARNYGSYTLGTFQNKDTFEDAEITDIINNFGKYKPYTPIPRKLKLGAKDNSSTAYHYYTFVFHDTFSGNVLNSAVFINVSEEWIHRMMMSKKAKGDGEGSTLIVDNNGMLVSNSSPYGMLSDISGENFMKTIANASSASGRFIDAVDGIKSLVTYIEPDNNGWRYIRITPYRHITDSCQKVRKLTIFIDLIFLVCGFIISMVISKKLYIPIGRVLENMKRLEAEMRDNHYTSKQDFLRNVLLGRETSELSEFQKKLDKFGIATFNGRKYCMILMKIDQYRSFCNQYTLTDRNLFKFAMMNMAAEICSRHFYTEAVDMGEDGIALIIMSDSLELTDAEDTFTQICEEIRGSVLNYINVSVSFTVSPVIDNFKEICFLYKQVVEASFHKLFLGEGCVIYAEKIMQYKLKTYTYPVNKEEAMIDAVMTGKADEAKGILNEIIGETAEYPYSVINLAISHLTLRIDNMIDTIQKNGAFTISNGFVSTIASFIPLNSVETIGEITQLFFNLIDEIVMSLDVKRSSKHDDLIRQINAMIEKEYANQDLCLNMIADKLDMSHAYIGRLYKQYTLLCVSDYINEVRMNKAKELLYTTRLPVSEIAEKTGFASSSYFFKLFRKVNGVTPNDFRSTQHVNHLT